MRRVLTILFFLLPVASFAKKQGQEYIDSLLQQLPQAKENTNKIKLLSAIARVYWAYDPDKGIHYAEETLSLSNKLDWQQGKALADYDLAVNYRYKSEYLKAITYINEGMRIWQEQRNKKDLGLAYNLKSIIYIDQSDYPQALDCGFKALKIFEELQNKNRIATALGNIGIGIIA